MATAIKDLSDGSAGVISYGGYDFPMLRKYTLEARDQDDEAGRATTGTRYMLRVLFYIPNATQSASATAMSSIREKLSKPGQELRITGTGIGDIRVNGGSSTHDDLEWGPKPKFRSFEMSGLVCCECVWECEFYIMECSGGGSSPIMAFNYEVAYAFDDAALCTRTVNGYLQIKQTRRSGGARVTDSADKYRTQIKVAVPKGFARKAQAFPLSKNKNRLDFFFVDQQLPGQCPPKDMIKADIDYELESSGKGFASSTATLSANFEVVAGKPASSACRAFLLIALEKFGKLKAAAAPGGNVLPSHVRFGHKLLTRHSSFSISFYITACLENILKKGGIWAPLNSSQYSSWASSMQNAWSVRGPANLIYNATEDSIVDLCLGNGISQIGRDTATEVRTEFQEDRLFGLGEISKQQSWLAFENSLVAYRMQNSTLHVVADGYSPRSLDRTDFENDEGVSLSTDMVARRYDVSQYQAAPTEYVLMRGKALRIKYQPAIPRLVSVGASREVAVVKEVTDGPKVVGCFLDTPVYLARWAILYRLERGWLGKVPVSKNPALCCDPSENSPSGQ